MDFGRGSVRKETRGRRPARKETHGRRSARKENNGRGRNKNKSGEAGEAEIKFRQRISEAGKAEKAVAEIVFMPVRAV